MEVKPGYKQTEVGIIPEDWGVRRLGDLAEMGSGGTPLSSVSAYYGGGIPWVSIADMTKGGKVIAMTEKTLTSLGLANSAARLFPAGTVLYAMYASLGECSVAAIPVCTSQAILGIRPKGQVDSEFLYYVLASMRAVVRTLGQQGTQANLNKGMVQDIRLGCPSRHEQRAIAAALSDVDALLGGLDRLIAKKRDLKQAAMQQLLTGQTRLPGFSGAWEVASLDMLTSRAAGVWGKSEPDERNNRRANIIRAGDISQDGRLTSTATRHVAPEEFEKAKCARDDLVITTSGNGLGKLWWCDGRSNTAASNFVRVLHPRATKVVGRFLYYALRTGQGVRQLQEHTATSAYPNLRPTYFSTPWIALPVPSEQAAIAAVLSDMDAELAALEARRDKTRDLKQAMMQELLTGRTRLV